MRRRFGELLLDYYIKDSNIILLTPDLGYRMFDRFRTSKPEQFYCPGASEFAIHGAAVGLCYGGKIPLIYNITSFLLMRPFEINKMYINDENVPVKLIGGGRDFDYKELGRSHCYPEAKETLTKLMPNIQQFWPESEDELVDIIPKFIYNNKPSFISLRR